MLVEKAEIVISNLIARSYQKSTVICETLGHLSLGNSVVLMSRVGSVLDKAELPAVILWSIDLLQTHYIKLRKSVNHLICPRVRCRIIDHQLGNLFALRKVSVVRDNS